MCGAKRKRNVLNVKQKLEILQKLDKGESASTDAEDVLNEGNAISHSAAQQSVETLLDYMGQRGFDYGDITACFRFKGPFLPKQTTAFANSAPSHFAGEALLQIATIMATSDSLLTNETGDIIML
ncbi:hypothetical protein AVEN_25610-1 [Araneus ventricosus]|uniref:HTH psq-type domain-containing protein n=1 Tax=Araneus ventricosus TaxID=182803 RepID=A0A4Y2BPS3_ARAVE|nr:hypothetical protein AVEN_25610-1 [Araneus ventricosus]